MPSPDKRILLVGNSHAVPMVEFFRNAGPEELGGWEATTFVAPASRYEKLSLAPDGSFGVPAGTELGPDDVALIQTLNGRTRIALRDFPVVAVMGERLGHEELSDLLAAHDVTGLFENGRASAISLPLFDRISATLAETYLAEWRWLGVGGKDGPRLVFVERARRSTVCFGVDVPKYRSFRAIGSLPASPDAAFRRHGRMAAARLAQAGAEFVPQPPETVEEHGLTHARFSKGVPRMAQEGTFPATDAMHMNGAYGRLCWAALHAHLEAAEGRAGAA